MKCENCKQHVAEYIAVVIDGSNRALCEACNNNAPNVKLPFEFERTTVFQSNAPNIHGFHYTIAGEKKRRELQIGMPQINIPFFHRALAVNGRWTFQGE